MKWNEFVAEGQYRNMPTIVEVYETKYPAYSSKVSSYLLYKL